MSRGFLVFGEFIVKVKGGLIQNQAELGLTADPVRVFPRYFHQDITTDDYGPNVPVETLWGMSEAFVFMNLVNFDAEVLGKCMRAAAGIDDTLSSVYPDNLDGYVGPVGRPMGRGLPLWDVNNNYLSVYLIPTAASLLSPYRFLACYLNSQPLEIPLGTERSVIRLTWRCVPYRTCTSGEITSADGTILFDHESS